MVKIETKSGEVLLVKVPEDVTWWGIIKNDFPQFITEKLNLNQMFLQYWEIIGKFSELEDEVFEEFVENTVRCNNCYWEDCEENLQTFTDLSSDIVGKEIQYFRGCPNCETDDYLTDISKESFQSLCKSQGIEDDLNNYLIIKKS